jgi:hypothetical protein
MYSPQMRAAIYCGDLIRAGSTQRSSALGG